MKSLPSCAIRVIDAHSHPSLVAGIQNLMCSSLLVAKPLSDFRRANIGDGVYVPTSPSLSVARIGPIDRR
jgi:hypothetical protein